MCGHYGSIIGRGRPWDSPLNVLLLRKGTVRHVPKIACSVQGLEAGCFTSASYKPVVSYSLIAMSKPSAKLHGSQGTGCSLVIWCIATTPILVAPKFLPDDANKCFLAPHNTPLLFAYTSFGQWEATIQLE